MLRLCDQLVARYVRRGIALHLLAKCATGRQLVVPLGTVQMPPVCSCILEGSIRYLYEARARTWANGSLGFGKLSSRVEIDGTIRSSGFGYREAIHCRLWLPTEVLHYKMMR